MGSPGQSGDPVSAEVVDPDVPVVEGDGDEAGGLRDGDAVDRRVGLDHGHRRPHVAQVPDARRTVVGPGNHLRQTVYVIYVLRRFLHFFHSRGDILKLIINYPDT